MNTITFAGIKAKIIKSSPHGNYLVVKLSDRITICGTFSNQYNWEESTEEESGFISFITYIGLRSPKELEKFKAWVYDNNGYFFKGESVHRQAERVQSKKFPYELKVRGLTPEAVLELVKAK